MATITLKGNEIHTKGELPAIGSDSPLFSLIKADLSLLSASELKGKKVVLNIFPSLDTGTCAASVRQFNKMASEGMGAMVVCISKDLPFAHKRFCEAEGLNDVVTASDFRDLNFGDAYGTTVVDGPLAGLHSRAVIVVNEEGDVVYTEQVPEITQEPNYEAALNALK